MSLPTGFNGLDLQGKKGRKEEHKPSCFVHALKPRGAWDAGGEAFGGCPIPGEPHVAQQTGQAGRHVRHWMFPPKQDACRWFFQEGSEAAEGFCC